MKKKSIFYIILFSLCICDERNFMFTYEKKMLEPGESEIELYVTNEYPNHSIFNNENRNTLKLQYEIEIGMTEDFEVAFYNTFIQKPNEGIEFDQYKLRFKYKVFDDKVKWTPILYSEIKGNLDFTEITLEQKFLFTEYFGNINFSFNPIIELEMAKNTINDKWKNEFEIEFAIGLSYNFKKKISAGFDIKISEYASYIGPVFSHGSDGKFWVFGIARKFSGLEEKPNLLLKSIMGFHF